MNTTVRGYINPNKTTKPGKAVREKRLLAKERHSAVNDFGRGDTTTSRLGRRKFEMHDLEPLLLKACRRSDHA